MGGKKEENRVRKEEGRRKEKERKEEEGKEEENYWYMYIHVCTYLYTSTFIHSL